MAITYPLTLPTSVTARNVTFRQVNAVALSQSPFTFQQQAVAHTGQRWECDFMLPPMARVTAADWIGFLSSLKGQLGTFLMGDPAGQAALGEAGGTPLVNGASQTGDELIIDGASTSQTDWLKRGDYIQLGTSGSTALHMVMKDVDTNSSGDAILDLWPSIRTAPADNAAVTVSATKGRWRLAANQMSWDINSASHHGLSFTAIEAISNG